ncbi:LPS translocon maturation chaperone LptM [Luteimonas arsenica]|uniref:LPS translocon maturation chaperone LptM n=1 Tax=Luteimonas arsenica TaxID=1586242 RepID=UPI001404F326|nr:lipoprotein [Luteimonas arsenica]
MNIRALLPLALLVSALALSACGNKGPLLPPPAPDDDEWPAEQTDDYDQDGEGEALDATGVDTDADDTDIDDEGDDPAEDPVPPAGDDGDGDA